MRGTPSLPVVMETDAVNGEGDHQEEDNECHAPDHCHDDDDLCAH